MFASLLITLREGLEAALVLGVAFSLLRKFGQQARYKQVWAGVLVGLMVSIAMGVALYSLGIEFEGLGEQIFEGVTALVAAAVLTYMIFWMQHQGRRVQAEMEADVRRAVSGGSAWTLFILAFVAVVREGIETALFLTAATFGSSPAQTLIGGAVGLLIAVFIGWLIFAAGRRLNVRLFFRVTSIFLILFAAGLLVRGAGEFQEAGIVPSLIEHVWDTEFILPEESAIGTFFTTLFGYVSRPSLLQIIVYVVYFVVIAAAIWRQGRVAKASST